MMAKKQIKLHFANVSESNAIAKIEQSIANGWQGLFDIKANGRNGGYTLPAVSSRPVGGGGTFDVAKKSWLKEMEEKMRKAKEEEDAEMAQA